jgi:uncharacterized protein (TIRG00374 family)
MKKKIFTVLRITITILLLYFIFSKVNVNEFLGAFSKLDKKFYLLAFLMILLNTFFLTKRIEILFSVFPNRPSFWITLKYYLIGLFFNQFLPTSVGGDAIKGYKLGKKVGSASTGLILTFIDRLIGLLTMIVYLLIALTLGGLRFLKGNERIWILAFALFLIVVSLLFFSHNFIRFIYRIFIKPFEKKIVIIEQVKEAYKFFLKTKNERSIYIKASIYSVTAQIAIIIACYLTGIGLGIDIPLLYYFILLPIIFVISMLPISVGGFGVREGAFVILLGRYGVDKNQSLALSLLYIILFIVICLPGGLFLILGEKGVKNGK